MPSISNPLPYLLLASPFFRVEVKQKYSSLATLGIPTYLRDFGFLGSSASTWDGVIASRASAAFGSRLNSTRKMIMARTPYPNLFTTPLKTRCGV